MKIDTIPLLDQIVNKHHTSETGLCRHYLTLYSIILGMEAKNVFEFGCGFSPLSMAKALELTGGKLSSIDLRSLDQRPDIPASLANKELWTFHEGNSLGVFPQLKHDECYDVVLHDGSHTASEVTIDLNNVAPFVKQGGLVLVHDTSHHDLGEDMIKGVNDSVLIKEYEHEIVTLPFGYGLTIIRVLNNPNNNKKINITWRKE